MAGIPLNATKACCTTKLCLAYVQVRFINAAAPHIGTEAAYAHGAHLVLLDGIGLGVGMPLQVCFLPLTQHMPNSSCFSLLSSTCETACMLYAECHLEGGNYAVFKGEAI